MTLNYELSNLALKDLEEIWNYTAEQWSKQQANKYYKQIFKSIEQICINPGIGRSIHEVKKEYKRMNTNFHMIIYKTSKTKLYVDRILHQKMDIEGQLDE